MRRTSSVARQGVLDLTHLKTALFFALAALTLVLFAPARAHAQSDAIRIMAGRVLDEAVNRGVDRRGTIYGDRTGGIYRDDDIYRRDRDAWEREQIARERWCREHPSDRRCDDRLFDRRNDNGNWCWDRDRNGRCDNRQQMKKGKGRGSWRDDDGGWMPPGQRKKRGW